MTHHLIFLLVTIFYNSHSFLHSTSSRYFKSKYSKFSLFATYKQSLQSGTWIKFISGASNQDLSLVRNLCLTYTSVGVDCIDISPDPAIILAASEGIQKAIDVYPNISKPLLMISVNDDDDPHFRKAYFDPSICPTDCKRPCEKSCPASAIPAVKTHLFQPNTGVIDERCYGCGRCIDICPLHLIQAKHYTVDKILLKMMLELDSIDAIEIHTKEGHLEKFQSFWNDMGASILQNVKIISISFPDMGNHTITYINHLYAIMSSSSAYKSFHGIHVWQTDGRPMSGDIGRGTAHASVEFAMNTIHHINQYTPPHIHSHTNSDSTNNDNNMESNNDSVPIYISINHDPYSLNKHYIQLAGGTNDYSYTLAKDSQLTHMKGFGGYAFGGYARKSLSRILHSLEDSCQQSMIHIEEYPIDFKQCREFATQLVHTIKSSSI